jgi:hypothetical protein
VTNYFGFPQPIEILTEFTKRHDLLLIEDNTHGLYSEDKSGQPLGSHGDLGIFSYPKCLPVPNGGAYVLNNSRLPAETPLPCSKPSGAAVVGKIKGLIEAYLLRRYPKGARAIKVSLIDPLVEFLKQQLYSEYQPKSNREAKSAFGGTTLVMDRVNWDLSAISRFLLVRADHAAIKQARQWNYRALDQHIVPGDRVRPLLDKMPDGACPWIYPLWVEAPATLTAFMRAHYVECTRFWPDDHPAVSLEDFPFERNLRQHVMILPVHQGLTPDDMKSVAELLNRWNSQDLS